jgi:hypothetical protein
VTDVVASNELTADGGRWKPFRDDEVLSRENEGGGCGRGGAARNVEAMRSVRQTVRTVRGRTARPRAVGWCDCR